MRFVHFAASQRQSESERSSLASRSLSLTLSLFFLSLSSLRLSRSLPLVRVPSRFHLLRPFVSIPRRTFGQPFVSRFPSRSRCPSARFPFFSSFPSLFLSLFLSFYSAAADAQPVLHRQIDSTLRTSRRSERGSSSRIPEFAPVG